MIMKGKEKGDDVVSLRVEGREGSLFHSQRVKEVWSSKIGGNLIHCKREGRGGPLGKREVPPSEKGKKANLAQTLKVQSSPRENAQTALFLREGCVSSFKSFRRSRPISVEGGKETSLTWIKEKYVSPPGEKRGTSQPHKKPGSVELHRGERPSIL